MIYALRNMAPDIVHEISLKLMGAVSMTVSYRKLKQNDKKNDQELFKNS